MTVFPNIPHIVLAHSHGGSVAAIAACELEAAECEKLTVIALASPFSRPQFSFEDPTRTHRCLLLRLGLASAATIFAISVGAFGLYFHLDQISPWIAVAFPAIATAVYQRVARRFAVDNLDPNKFVKSYSMQKYFGLFMRGMKPTPAAPIKLFAIRAANDEASLVIGASQFIELVADFFGVTLVNSLIQLLRRLIGRYGVATFIALTGIFAFYLLRPISWAATIATTNTLAIGVLISAAAALMIIRGSRKELEALLAALAVIFLLPAQPSALP